MDVLSLPMRMRSSIDLPDSHLLVKGLPPSIDEQSLYDIFSKFGEIQSCRLVPTSSSTNQAVVNLSSSLQAQDAVTALNGAPTDRGVLEVVASSAGASKSSEPLALAYHTYIVSSCRENQIWKSPISVFASSETSLYYSHFLAYPTRHGTPERI